MAGRCLLPCWAFLKPPPPFPFGLTLQGGHKGLLWRGTPHPADQPGDVPVGQPVGTGLLAVARVSHFILPGQAAHLCLIPIRPAGPDLHASRPTMTALRAMKRDFALVVNQATPNKAAKITGSVRDTTARRP
jgi:hypothetical protein